MKKIAIIGDVHGCIAELSILFDRLQDEAVTEIYHLGDLVDRGPDSGAVVSLMRDRKIFGVMGNHESKILDLLKKNKASEIKSEDKRRTAESLLTRAGNIEYLVSLPRIHVLEALLPQSVVLVHGGLWPRLPLWKQPFAVMMAQRIEADRPGSVAWLQDEQARAKGMVPWWDVWDGEELAVFGHTVFEQPRIFTNAIGIDTGCVFGGSLTALILPDKTFIQVKAEKAYATREKKYSET